MNNGVIDFRRLARVGIVALATGLGLGGCASQQNLDIAKDENRSLKERNEELARQNQELQNENSLLQKQRNANEAALGDLSRLNDTLKKQLADAGIDINALMDRMGKLTMTPIDPETDRALTALAAQYPDIIKYDSAKGMLRFASDLTFASGQDSVTESARQSLSALSKILTSGHATAYDIMIMGHTDTQQISSGTATRHPTNVHLSAHRAIAVRKELATMGVTPDKMMVAGWGEFRPAVPNSGPKGNTPQNRRVEIFLTRSTAPSMSGETTRPTADAEHKETTRQADPMK